MTDEERRQYTTLKKHVPTDEELKDLRRPNPRRASDFIGPGRRLQTGWRQFGYWLRWQAPFLFVVMGMFYLSYQARLTSIEGNYRVTRSQQVDVRNGCLRDQKDHYQNAESWYGAYRARLTDARARQNSTRGQQRDDLSAAHDYLLTVQSLMRHTNAANQVDWPRGSGRHPNIGVKPAFSCDRAYPLPARPSVPFFSIG